MKGDDKKAGWNLTNYWRHENKQNVAACSTTETLYYLLTSLLSRNIKISLVWNCISAVIFVAVNFTLVTVNLHLFRKQFFSLLLHKTSGSKSIVFKNYFFGFCGSLFISLKASILVFGFQFGDIFYQTGSTVYIGITQTKIDTDWSKLLKKIKCLVATANLCAKANY